MKFGARFITINHKCYPYKIFGAILIVSAFKAAETNGD